MLESMHFSFNGISSKEMGVMIVNTGGLHKENFLPNRKLITTKSNQNPIPFFQRVEEDSFSFSLTLHIVDWDKRNQLRSVARWLYTDYHKPLIFESNSDLVLYGMFVDKSELNHNGVKEGYITLTFQSKSPYIYSRQHKIEYDVNSVLTETFYNNGDLPLRFKMTILSKSAQDIKITASEEGFSEQLSLRNIYAGETVYLDCEREYIISSEEDRLGRYLGDNHNDVWLEIPPESQVELKIEGSCKIALEYQYKYLTYDNELAYI